MHRTWSQRLALPLPAVLTALAALASLGACSKAPPEPPSDPAETPEALVGRMNAAIDALMARPEHGADEVEVQHVLIGVSGRLPGVTRTPAESEVLAAQVYARALAGEQFDTLERNFSGDVHPGIYTLSAQPSDTPGRYARADMVAGFGDVAWRLEPGEVGVAPYDGVLPGEARSPFGYHVIKRLR